LLISIAAFSNFIQSSLQFGVHHTLVISSAALMVSRQHCLRCRASSEEQAVEKSLAAAMKAPMKLGKPEMTVTD